MSIPVRMRGITVIPILIAMLVMPLRGRAPQDQKPFTQEQVKAMVRDGLANDMAAKAVAAQGIDFTPTDDFLRVLQAAGASEAFLQALRGAPHPTEVARPDSPSASAPPPLDLAQLLALMAGGVPDQRIIEVAKQRGVMQALHGIVTDRESPIPTWLRSLGVSNDLLSALRFANVLPNPPAAVAQSHMLTAKEEFTQELKQNPRNHAARFGLVVMVLPGAEAVGLMRDAVALEPTDPWPHFMLGTILTVHKDKDEAMTEFRRTLQLKPNYLGAHIGLGDLLWEGHDREGALAEYREEIRVNPKELWGRSQLVDRLTEMGKWDEATSAADEELRLAPDDAGAHYALGQVLVKSHGDAQQALQEFRKAYELEPDNDTYRQTYQAKLNGLNLPPIPASAPPGPSGGEKPGAGPAQIRENSTDGLKYVWIPPGTFMMGCSQGDSECAGDQIPLHQVTITRGFWMGQTPVTVGAYKRFAAAAGRPMPLEPNLLGRTLNAGWKNEGMPMVNVTWDEAQAYCAWGGGRLPTEAEWEYAARGGSTESRYGPVDEVAWDADNSGLQRLNSTLLWNENQNTYAQHLKDNGNGMHAVGLKRPNAFGLYDALGNVLQWVNDWYDQNYYQSSPPQDPQGPSNGQNRILRGASWLNAPRYVSVSSRNNFNPASRNSAFGLRCVGEAGGPPSTRLTSTPLNATPSRIQVGGQVQSAKLISHSPPEYPSTAKMARIQGVVRLNVIIGKDGTIEELKVISGHPLLTKAAMDAVEKWTYQPTLLNGEPVEVSTEIDVNFTLSE